MNYVMNNNRPSVIRFKPKKRPDGRKVDDYLLKEGEEYAVIQMLSNSKYFFVQNGAGIVVQLAKSDAEIV